MFWSFFLCERVYVRASYFFCCTRFLNTEKNYKSQSRQMDSWLLVLVLVVAVVVMGQRAKGCQVGSAVSLRKSQDHCPHCHFFFLFLVASTE